VSNHFLFSSDFSLVTVFFEQEQLPVPREQCAGLKEEASGLTPMWIKNAAPASYVALKTCDFAKAQADLRKSAVNGGETRAGFCPAFASTCPAASFR
jgi:hypothetical protein